MADALESDVKYNVRSGDGVDHPWFVSDDAFMPNSTIYTFYPGEDTDRKAIVQLLYYPEGTPTKEETYFGHLSVKDITSYYYYDWNVEPGLYIRAYSAESQNNAKAMAEACTYELLSLNETYQIGKNLVLTNDQYSPIWITGSASPIAGFYHYSADYYSTVPFDTNWFIHYETEGYNYALNQTGASALYVYAFGNDFDDIVEESARLDREAVRKGHRSFIRFYPLGSGTLNGGLKFDYYLRGTLETSGYTMWDVFYVFEDEPSIAFVTDCYCIKDMSFEEYEQAGSPEAAMDSYGFDLSFCYSQMEMYLRTLKRR